MKTPQRPSFVSAGAAPDAEIKPAARRHHAAGSHDDHRHEDGHDHRDLGHDDGQDHHAQDHPLDWQEGLRIALVAVAAAAVWFGWWEPYASVSVIGVIGLMIGGWPIFKEAVENAIARRMTMELSMSIAIIAAAAISEFFTALTITLFVLVAEVLEGMTVSRGRRAIRELLDFLPREVSVRRAGAVSQVHADALAVGDAVLVNSGGRVPVDGSVIAGHSFVDLVQLRGHHRHRPAGHRAGGGRFAQSPAGRLHPCGFGTDLHLQFGELASAARRRSHRLSLNTA